MNPTHYDVFISYSSHDKIIADAICSRLENNNIRCWIAPRDILPGLEFGEAIIDGIVECKILLLVFSSKSNESPQVKREVERAVSKGKIIIPFRIEEILPTKAMEYALSNTHWLDAMTPPLETHIATLTATVLRLLDIPFKNEKSKSERVGNTQPIIVTEMNSETSTPVQPSESQKTIFTDNKKQEPYTPKYNKLTGLKIQDSAGEETILFEFGIIYNPYGSPTLENSWKGSIIIEKGSGSQNIPWTEISKISIQDINKGFLTLLNGKILGPVKLRAGSLVGIDENQFVLKLELSKIQEIYPVWDNSLNEFDSLIRDIPLLAKQTKPNVSYTCAFTLNPDKDGVTVTLDSFFHGKLQASQTFHMPGDYKFWVDDKIVGVKAKEYYNLGPFDTTTAQTLAFALNRLNALLSEQND